MYKRQYILVTLVGDSESELTAKMDRLGELAEKCGAYDTLVVWTDGLKKDVWAARSAFLTVIEADTKLLDELDVLGGLVDDFIDDAKGAGDAINDRVQGLTWQMDNLKNSADDISDRTTELYNGWTDGINEISSRVDEALDGVGPALDGFRDGLDQLSQFSGALEAVFDQINASGDDMKKAIDEGKDCLLYTSPSPRD